MQKTALQPDKKNAGFTLIEVVIAFGITVFATVIFSDYVINSYKTIDFVNGFNEAVESAKKSISIINKEVREAGNAENGSYALETANEQEIVFYSDADNDDQTEKIRCHLDGAILKKEVTEAGALPYAYSGTPEMNVLSENVENGTAPIFTYYDENNNLIANPSANINQIRLVHTYLEINTAPNRAAANYAIETSTNIRNLKINNANPYSNYVCGNGIIEGGEQCDCKDDENCSLAELDNETCDLLEYDKGVLRCSSCVFNTSLCAVYVNGQTLRHNGTAWVEDSNLFNTGTNIGIGTTNPGANNKLKVGGAVEITGDFTAGGHFNASGADLAEEFSTVNDLEDGAVVIMGDGDYKSVKPCDSAYDKKVMGVVSDNPSIIMGKIKGNAKEVIAIKGVVTVKATNKNGNIKKGNLLTSSEISGRAMKAAEIKTGTIIGKALEDCDIESCEIKAMINLR